jgi:hypothetical protein
MKVYEVLKMFAKNDIVPQVDDNRDFKPFFGKWFYEKGSNYRPFNDSGERCDAPFEFIWVWLNLDQMPDEILEAADIVLSTDDINDRIAIFEIVK